MDTHERKHARVAKVYPTDLMLPGRKRRRPVETLKQNKRPASITVVPTTNVTEEQLTSSIVFQGRTAVANLKPGQLLALNGCTIVCLLEGSSSVVGYSLIRGVQVLVSSDSRLCSALTFEAKCSGCRLQFQPLKEHDSFTLELVQANVETSRSRKRKAIPDVPSRNMRPTIIPPVWWTEADSIVKQDVPPIVLVCGAKGAGKSTFGRFLVNRLLESHKAVAYLDTDVGQPEFTIPGCISLHVLKHPVTSAPELRDPERCFLYGDISSKTDPEFYMKLVVTTYDYFRHHYYSDAQRLPLVMNTPGKLKGMGYDILVDILRYTVPTHLVKIGDADLPTGHFWEDRSSTKIMCIKSYSSDEPACVVTPAELRASKVVAYFQQCIEKTPALASVAKALTGLAPYQVPASQVDVVHLHIQVPASHNLYSLNAQLVGLAVSSQADEHQLPCIGFGVIRGVDTIANVIYLLTPCSLDVLEDVDTVIHGRVELPAALLQFHGCGSPYLCRKSVLVGTGSSVLHRRRKASRVTKKRKFV